MLDRRPVAAAGLAAAVGLFGLSTVASAEEAVTQPNVIFVLVDDLSANLLPYMSEVTALAEDGITLPNYFNATPWCCPSRASIQAGKYPHNTQVRSNGYPIGGFEQFMLNDMDNSIGVQMGAAGYRTGLMGKYLNDYYAVGQQEPDRPDYPANFVPPGWDSWFSGTGYPQFRYDMVVDEAVGDEIAATTLHVTGKKAENYYTDVLSVRAQSFVRDQTEEPFFLMLTPFAPHGGIGRDPEGAKIRFPAAPRDRADSRSRPSAWGEPEFPNGDCGPIPCMAVPWPDTTAPAAFNLVAQEPLSWMATSPLSNKKLKQGREYHLQRIQAVQSVNDMLRDLRETLAQTGQAENTWIMFTSDNGYHLGEHALFAGKTTAYDHDIKTPLIVRPPGGTGGVAHTASGLVQNTDVLPTLIDIAGAEVPADVDGASMLPLMADPSLEWRDNVLLELTNDDSDPAARRSNPDTQGAEGDHVAPSYNALRGTTYLYVDYSAMDSAPPENTEAEYYDLTSDPDQTTNIYRTLDEARRVELNAALLSQTSCSGLACRTLQGLEAAPPTDPPTEPPPTDPPPSP